VHFSYLCIANGKNKAYGYPFSGDSDFGMRLRQVINQTMEVDIPQYANMNASTGRKLKKLLAVIAQSVPFKPVMDSLATVIGVSRNVLPDYFLYMEQAGMIGQLRDDTGGILDYRADSWRL